MNIENNPMNPEEEINNIINFLQDYFNTNGPTSKAIIGISGGKDSSIAAALLVRALGADRVIGVLMPEGAQKDIEDAILVCECLKIKYYELNIGNTCQELYSELAFTRLPLNDTITTNTPARIRMATLYMVAAAVGGRVANTCNYSEDYIGYSTKYGDLAGDFSVLNHYTYTEVLAIGDQLKELPAYLVHKPPADGMCGKTDEDNFGFTYKELDDYILNEILPSEQVLNNILNRHNRNKHKGCLQLPSPIPKWWFKVSK